MTKSWILGCRSGALTAGLVLSAGVLLGGCASAYRTVSHLGPTPAQVAPSRGQVAPSQGQPGRGTAPTAAATPVADRRPSASGPGSKAPGSRPAKTVLAPTAPGSGRAQPAPPPTLNTAPDQAAIDQSLTQIESGLAGVDQATRSGETDVPSN